METLRKLWRKNTEDNLEPLIWDVEPKEVIEEKEPVEEKEIVEEIPMMPEIPTHREFLIYTGIYILATGTIL